MGRIFALSEDCLLWKVFFENFRIRPKSLATFSKVKVIFQVSEPRLAIYNDFDKNG
jgi:hypothetical protein